MSEEKTEHILVVDDDALVRRSVLRILRANGYCHLHEAASATEGARVFRLHKDITTILTDTHMDAGETGMDLHHAVLDELRARKGKLLAMTASTEPATRATWAQLGITVIPKPFDMEVLLAHLR